MIVSYRADKQQVSDVNAVGFQGKFPSKSLKKNKLFEGNYISGSFLLPVILQNQFHRYRPFYDMSLAV